MGLDPSTYASDIRTGLPGSVPENFTDPQVIAAVKMFISGANALVRAIEQYAGATKKEATQWSFLTPNDTILKSNLGRFYVRASENLQFNDFINIWNNAGVANIRKATSFDGATFLPAHGYITQAALSGELTECIVGQGLLAVTNLLPGQNIYLSSTSGLAALTPDTNVGHLAQYLGVGISLGLAYIDITLGQYIEN